MPYDPKHKNGRCLVCQADATVYLSNKSVIWRQAVNCSICGDFQIEHETVGDLGLPFTEPKQQILARHAIRKATASGTWPLLTKEFFQALRERTLPTPAELLDNLLIWIADQADGSPGKIIDIGRLDDTLNATVGVRGGFDIEWIVGNLVGRQLFKREGNQRAGVDSGRLTASGWQRVDDLRRAHISSKYAFFARQFQNSDLDRVYAECLAPAVRQTGYELRIVPQQAGLIDALIEDAIRRCRFLIADLSDNNGGAYWEAGFAEGLGKPVIYICRADVKTHFDTNHRHTVRWDLSSLSATAEKLKAVIRNTLLGDAKQIDD
jgi:hypothetical protein